MAGQEDEVTPKTLADPVPPVSETLSVTDRGDVNGARVSVVSVEGFDINAPLDEDGATAVTTGVVQSEEATVDTIIRLGPGELDNGLVEPEGDGVFSGADVQGLVVGTPKDVETDNGLFEPEGDRVFLGADVQGPLVETPKEVETDNGMVEPEGNGGFIAADVQGTLVETPMDGERDNGVVEPEGDGVFLAADVQGTLVGTPKDVETDNGDRVNGDRVNVSAFDTATDCDTGNPRMENVLGDSDVQGPLFGTPKDVETDNSDGVSDSAFDTSTDCDSGNPRMVNVHGDSDVEMDGVTEEHGYSVGELVWGKIKSHPWWPGQIYDPSDACVAMNLDTKGRLLVAFFGDGTFAWCLPSQLIPFAEHFEKMSKQSGPKTFMSAVAEAVDEIGRLVDLEMTCACVPEKNRKGLERAPVVNAGIKPGVVAPEGNIGKLLSFRCDPSELLATVAITANTLSLASVLELSILKGWLSSFYRARGGYSLPLYHEPVLVEGLEDQSENDSMGTNNAIVAVNKVLLKGPAEEECGPGNGPASLLENIPNRRKQKSVAELMAADTNTTPQNRKGMNARVEGRVSNSANKKRKANVEDGSCSSIAKGCPTQRKRGRKDMVEVSGYKISKPGNGGTSEEKLPENNMSKKLLKVDIPRESNEQSADVKCPEGKFSPRERKKSKYLSLPYTSPRSRVGYPSYKDEERESEKMTGISRVGERMTKAAIQILDSTPLNCNGKTEKKQVPIVYSREKAVKSADFNSKAGKPDKKNSIITLDANAAVEEVLSGLNSVAAGPFISLNASRLEVTRDFISAFRNSTYLNGSKRMVGRTTESVNFEHENVVNESNQTGIDLPADQARGKKRERNSNILRKSDEGNSDTPKPKRPARCSTKKGNLEGVEREAPLASSFVLTFAPAFPLPSKVEIIETFSKFGNINENETGVFPDSRNVKIVYMNSGRAEAALRASLSEKPFGSAIVDYNLSYSSDTSVTIESGTMASLLEGLPDGHAVSGSASENMPQLDSIRQKLEILATMLEKFDDNVPAQVMSSLDGEMKILVEKVRTIAAEASS